ncbi:MAG TPA: M90 family metallopeptidase [Candidatus Binatia bacterium]
MLKLLRERSRRRLRALPADPAWDAILERRFVLYRRLAAVDRDELLAHSRVLVHEKRFEGCGGLDLTDEVRVLIAAQASLLLLHRDSDYYPRLMSILVYPDAYVVPVEYDAGGGMVLSENVDHIGESWETGSLIVSWNDVLAGASGRDHGCNVVLHEFAHQVDAETGGTDGTPRIDDPELRERWQKVFEREYERLCEMADRRRRTFIDEYGAEHPSEFFAVATEHFFMEPRTFAKRHPELYRVLAEFWRQDPAAYARSG